LNSIPSISQISHPNREIGDRADVAEIADLLARDAFIVADSGAGRLAGAVYVRAAPPRGYFGMLSVQPDLQGAGLGRKLIEAAEAHCAERGCSEMDLTVVNLRTELTPFYERLGYRQSGTEPEEAAPAEEFSMAGWLWRNVKWFGPVMAGAGAAAGYFAFEVPGAVTGGAVISIILAVLLFTLK